MRSKMVADARRAFLVCAGVAGVAGRTAQRRTGRAQGPISRPRRTGRSVDRRAVEAAFEACEALSGTQGDQVLVNQGLHADNVVSAVREPWLVIDPKPLVGEREVGVAAIVRDSELGHSRGAVARASRQGFRRAGTQPRACSSVDGRTHRRVGVRGRRADCRSHGDRGLAARRMTRRAARGRARLSASLRRFCYAASWDPDPARA
jgi:hypothetical protein